MLTRLADRAGDLFVGGDAELVARVGDGLQSEHLHRCGRTGRLELLALVVEHRPDATPCRPGDDRIADLELALVDEHGGHGAATDVEVGLEHDALGPTGGVGRQLLELGDDEDLIEQLVDAEAFDRRHLDDDRVAAPRLGHELVLGELGEHALRIGVVLVDLVDGDDDRHLGGAGVVDGLDCLGHHAVVGGDNKDDDVGGLRTPCAHLRERGVARGVDERDRAALVVDLVRPDVLGDAACLAGDDVRLADAVEQRGLAVVDVSHDRDHGWPRLLGLLVLVVAVVEQRLQLHLLVLAGLDEQDVSADLEGEQLHLLVGEGGGGSDHVTVVEQEAHHIGGRAVELRPVLLRRHAALDDHGSFGNRGVARRVAGVLRLQLFAVATATATASAPGWATTTTRAGAPAAGAGATGCTGGPAAGPGRAATRAASEAGATWARTARATGAGRATWSAGSGADRGAGAW